MDYILNAYVLKNKVPYDTIIKDDSQLKNQTFEEYVLYKIKQHVGKSDKELCEAYDREYNKNKAMWSDLAYRMLGIKGNHAEEFVKAGIVVKTIRIEANETIRESMSLPPFMFKDLVEEEWEMSMLYEYLSETKFLFVVYKHDGECYRLLNAQLWNMPYGDLYNIVYDGWINVQNVIKSGVKFQISDNYVRNNLPKKADNPIIHVRPHAQNSAFKLNCGYSKGDIKKNANELPNGEWMTTQSFWLNNTYILSQMEIK